MQPTPTARLLKELRARGRLKERCGLEPRTNFFRLTNRQKLVRIRFGCGLHSRIYGTFRNVRQEGKLQHVVWQGARVAAHTGQNCTVIYEYVSSNPSTSKH